VTDRGHGRLVYSTNAGRICPGCGWPADDCQCSKLTTNESIPAKPIAKLRVEKKGRGGKTVTVVDGLPRNAEFLKTLGQELKRACGTGGAVLDGAIECKGIPATDPHRPAEEVSSSKGEVESPNEEMDVRARDGNRSRRCLGARASFDFARA
jgi:translation initiation factor 1